MHNYLVSYVVDFGVEKTVSHGEFLGLWPTLDNIEEIQKLREYLIGEIEKIDSFKVIVLSFKNIIKLDNLK